MIAWGPGAAVVVVLVARFVRRRQVDTRDRAVVRRRLVVAPAGGHEAIAPVATAVVGGTDRLARALGAWLRARTRRTADRAGDRRAGWATLIGLAVVVLAGPVAGALAAAVSLVAPVAGAHVRRRRRLEAVTAQIPDVIDLLRLAVESALEIGPALTTVAEHVEPGDVAEVLDRVSRRIVRGDRLLDALAELERLGEPARAMREALVASCRYGVPLVPALERAAGEARDVRRRRREEAARALPVKLLLPLVGCTLPALVTLTVVPLLLRSFPSLTL